MKPSPGRGRRLHAEQHRRLVRVVAGADVLDVEDQQVEPRELLRRGRSDSRGLAVERVGGHAGARVALAAHRRHVLRVAADAVLRAEERREPTPGAAWRRSAAWRSLRVTEVGLQTSPTRRPASGRKRLAGEDLEPGDDPARATGASAGTRRRT